MRSALWPNMSVSLESDTSSLCLLCSFWKLTCLKVVTRLPTIICMENSRFQVNSNFQDDNTVGINWSLVFFCEISCCCLIRISLMSSGFWIAVLSKTPLMALEERKTSKFGTASSITYFFFAAKDANLIHYSRIQSFQLLFLLSFLSLRSGD